MRIPLKSLRNVVNISNGNHRIFKTAAGPNCRLLVRSIRWSGMDENSIFSDRSPRSFSDPSKTYSRITEGFDSRGLPYYGGTGAYYFSPLSPDNFSPMAMATEETSKFPNFNGYNLVGSCRGLVCLGNIDEEAVIWNPSTNEVKYLPKSDLGRPDPAKALPLTITTFSLASGFGFDYKSHDYKFLRWVCFYFEEVEDEEDGVVRLHDSYSIVELYSLKTDSWKLLHNPTERGASPSAGVNGDFYWTIDGRIFPSRIQRFDFSTEKFSYIPFPHTGKLLQGKHTHKLFDFGGRLGVVVYPRFHLIRTEGKFEIWSWNEGCWSLVFDDYIADAREPIGFSRDGPTLFLVGKDHILRVYDLHTKQAKKVDVYCNKFLFELIPYVESLHPLNGESEAAAQA